MARRMLSYLAKMSKSSGYSNSAQRETHMSEQAQDWTGESREDHCTHPTQKWCDCDWCRYLRAQIKPYVPEVN
jgi:hypothetical protein